MSPRIAFLLLVCLLASCSSPLPDAQPPTPILPSPLPSPLTPIPSPLSPPLDTPSPIPDPASPLPSPQYILTATLTYDAHHLAVEQRITYPNRSGAELTELPLIAAPMLYTGVFNLLSLAWEDGTAVENVRREGETLTLPLRQPLADGQALALTLSYEMFLPSPTPSAETRPVPFGYTAHQANLVDWHPYIPPYLPGKGWLVHPAGYFGEHLAYEPADFRVSLRIPDGGEGMIVAASSLPESDGEWLRYTHQGARNFAFSASREYQVSEADAGGVRVLSYHFPVHAVAGEAALQTTAQALDIYGRLFGAYPRQALSVVEADFLDGMEYDGLYFLSHGFYNLYQGQPADYLTAIAAHETAHQWFYALVGNDQALEPWLDEALCTYSERLYYENASPDALDWWWTYRVNYYAPQGWVDGSIYNPAGYRAYRDTVYLNGAVFLEELRKAMGNEAFFAFLADYVAQNAGRIATREDFFAALSEHTQVDLQPLLEKYFSAP
ncbi:MAG: M1 family metallopeptidase [Chloroflexi bacterium]|nr:M1 family metallopeptidase [Chloroflexota bacterium]